MTDAQPPRPRRRVDFDEIEREGKAAAKHLAEEAFAEMEANGGRIDLARMTRLGPAVHAAFVKLLIEHSGEPTTSAVAEKPVAKTSVAKTPAVKTPVATATATQDHAVKQRSASRSPKGGANGKGAKPSPAVLAAGSPTPAEEPGKPPLTWKTQRIRRASYLNRALVFGIAFGAVLCVLAVAAMTLHRHFNP
ncbi:MAG: hypothetical protein K2X57_03470 [Xanthobacteraceae bacterium]|nr:hypothetical protein [Xanthobacteraceae bacterium]MBY0611232.1 hypothetical protein [Beijerinckiaceae bacterium]